MWAVCCPAFVAIVIAKSSEASKCFTNVSHTMNAWYICTYISLIFVGKCRQICIYIYKIFIYIYIHTIHGWYGGEYPPPKSKRVTSNGIPSWPVSYRRAHNLECLPILQLSGTFLGKIHVCYVTPPVEPSRKMSGISLEDSTKSIQCLWCTRIHHF